MVSLFQSIPDKDIFVCESRYSTKHKAFKKIKVRLTSSLLDVSTLNSFIIPMPLA